MAQGQIFRANASDQPAWSTATYPDTAGSNGNVLVSDGTNWSSSAPSLGSSFKGFLSCGGDNPADSTTYYFVEQSTFSANTTSTLLVSRFYAPASFTITKVYARINVDGTLGSAENGTFFIRKNDTTNTNISTTVQLTAATNTVSNTGLSVSFVAGDFFVFGFTTPAWATNPTTVGISIGWAS